MNKRAKGRRLELRAKKMLEDEGYSVLIAPGATRYQKQTDLLGLWDLIAFRGDGIRFIQVKANQWRMGKQVQEHRDWEAPPNSTKELWKFDDGEKEPKIKTL